MTAPLGGVDEGVDEPELTAASSRRLPIASPFASRRTVMAPRKMSAGSVLGPAGVE